MVLYNVWYADRDTNNNCLCQWKTPSAWCAIFDNACLIIVFCT